MPIKSIRSLYQARPCFDAPAGGGGGGAFDPSTLGAAMVSWYKADTGALKAGFVAAANGDEVVDWNDQGVQNVPEERVTTGPLFNSTGFNSLPSIDFAPARSSGMTSHSTLQPTLNSPTASLFVAVKVNGAVATGTFAALASAGGLYAGNDGFALFFHVDTTHICLYGAGAFLVTDAPWSSSNHTAGAVFDGANATLYVDGVSVGSHAWTTNLGSATHSDNGLLLGADGLGNFADVSIAEVILTNTVLVAADVHSYMATRLGF